MSAGRARDALAWMKEHGFFVREEMSRRFQEATILAFYGSAVGLENRYEIDVEARNMPPGGRSDPRAADELSAWVAAGAPNN